MSIAVRRIDKTFRTIELEHRPIPSITIPIEPTRRWSIRQDEEAGKIKSKIHFTGEEDFARVLESGIYVGRKHVEFYTRQAMPNVRRKKRAQVPRESTKVESYENISKPIKEELPVTAEIEIESLPVLIERKPVYTPTKRKREYRQTRSVPVSISKPALGGVDNLTEDGSYDARLLDPETLTLAIIRSGKYPNIDINAAEGVANYILNFFGNRDRIIDNILDPEDRDPFYMLEDAGILKTDREETTLYDGKEWRIHYWILVKDTIYDMAKRQREVLNSPNVEDVYGEIPDSTWQRVN